MKLSIITINYNNLKGLRKTIDSVLCQTWKDFEWIIIDGGSNDGSKELIEKTAAECQNISYWCSEPDEGVYNAMNKGIAHANGEYLNFMNSGDMFFNPQVLFEIMEKLDGTDIVYGNTAFSNGAMSIAPKQISGDFFFMGYTLCHQSCFIKTDLQKRYMYDENLKIVSDRKFFMQALLLDNASYMSSNKMISLYDITGISSDNDKLLKELDLVFNELFSRRLLDLINDYVHGNTMEEKFFVKLRTSNYRKYVYSLLVFIFKFLSLFKKDGSWVKEFHIRG